MDSVALASVNAACTFGSVRSLAFRVFPILVSALPDLPWHWAQFASQFAFASAARRETAEAAKRLTIMVTITFMANSFQELFRFLRLIPGGQTSTYPLDSARRVLFENCASVRAASRRWP